MTTLFLALALAAQAQAGTNDGVILSASPDTAFILPLSTLRRTDELVSATLVQIFPDVGEAWEEVRRDAVVEIDCGKASWRAVAETRIAQDGSSQSSETNDADWEEIPADYPPTTALRAIGCDGLDVSAAVLADWESRIPEIRAALR